MLQREIIALSAPRNRASGHVRIISGQWRGRKLPVIDSQGLRPTTDRTKETLFNWLMHDIRESRCLDAFAGAGSLGFEALSRGAQDLLLIEKDPQSAKILKQNALTLGANAQVICSDALTYLQQQSKPFDIVFVDPPYQQQLVEPCMELLLSRNLLTEGALVYVEHEAQLTLKQFAPLQVIKEKTTTQFRYALYQYSRT